MSNEVLVDRNSNFMSNILNLFNNSNINNENNRDNNVNIEAHIENNDIQIVSDINDKVQIGSNQLMLKTEIFDEMILIKNPNNEVAVGIFSNIDYNENDVDGKNYQYDKNKEKEIENYHKPNLDKDFDIKSTCSEKVVTLQTYEAIPQATLEQILNLVDPRNASLLNPISQQRFFSYKIESLLIKYTIFVISMMMFVIELKTIRNRFLNDEFHISKLRVIFIQMNDSQLIQLFYSFLIVYIIMSISSLFIGLLSLVYDSISLIRLYMNITCLSMIFLLLELNTKSCDLILIILKFIILALSKKWLHVNVKLFQAILLNPEYLEFNRL